MTVAALSVALPPTVRVPVTVSGPSAVEVPASMVRPFTSKRLALASQKT